jgi:acetyl esterase/lipase
MSCLLFQVRGARVCRFLFWIAALAMGAARAQDVAPATAGGTTALAPFRAYETFRDLPYVPRGGPRQRLDLYLPAHAATPCPLVVYIHGGAWRTGTKADSPALLLAALGYAAASIDYRLSQDATWPAQIEDCKAAIRWLRAHSREYGIDANHIGVWGASAGGQLELFLFNLRRWMV